MVDVAAARPAGTAASDTAGPWDAFVGSDPASALAALGSSRRGLSAAEAAARLQTSGPNSLPRARGRSVAAQLLGQLTNMFAVVLLVAAGLTFCIYWLSSPRDPSNLELAFGILAVVVLNALIGFTQEHAAERTAEALQGMVPHTARVIRDGEISLVAAEALVPGDVVVLDAGDAVSADCRVIQADELTIEMATMTGESEPVARVAEASPAAHVIEARNCVFMGTTVTGGSGRAVVFATGMRTEFGRIYHLTATVRMEESPLQRNVSSMARRVAAVAIAMGALLFVLRLGSGIGVVASFAFALGVMVALVPEGLPATLSVSLAIGVRRMARRNAFIKRLAAVEALGSTTVICTDKTGTLTKAEMTLQQVYVLDRSHQVSGVGYAPRGEVDEPDDDVLDVLRVGARCCDARLLAPSGGEGWRVLGDTTEGAILVAAAKAGLAPADEHEAAPRVRAFPFDPDRKMMSTLHRVGDHFELCLKGAPQAVLGRCRWARQPGGRARLDPALVERITKVNDAMAADALRVLAVATRDVESELVGQDEAEQDLTFLGLVGMSDPPRPEIGEAVRACRRAGIAMYMVTGDYGLTAEAVARRIGIVEDGPLRVVSGSDLDACSDAQLEGILRGGEQLIFARVRPEHKLRVVAALEALGEVVAVTGDGANDAPALKRASIGVAMGASGTDVARSAAVMVLLDDSFASIAAAVELGRSVYQNIRHFLVYIFSHNLAELAPILVAALVGFPLVPLTALQVLSIDLGSDVLPGLALGAGKPEPGTMDRPPRPPSERLFSWSLVRRFLFLGGIQSVGVVFAFFWKIDSAHLPYHAFTSSNPIYREALTMTLVGIMVSQLFNRFTVRSDRESIIRMGLLSSRPLLLASTVDVSFAFAVSYVPAFQDVFHTAPLSLSDWSVLVGFGALLLVADEIRKAFLRKERR